MNDLRDATRAINQAGEQPDPCAELRRLADEIAAAVRTLLAEEEWAGTPGARAMDAAAELSATARAERCLFPPEERALDGLFDGVADAAAADEWRAAVEVLNSWADATQAFIRKR